MDGGVALEQVGPGRFSGPLSVQRDAIALVTARYVTRVAGNGAERDFAGSVRTAWVQRSVGEWERASGNEALLIRAADAAHGRVLSLSRPEPLFSREGVRFPTWTRDIWQLFAVLAALAFVADVACRRLVHARWRPHAADQVHVSPPAPPSPPASPQHPTDVSAPPPDARLSRLQQAKRRATER